MCFISIQDKPQLIEVVSECFFSLDTSLISFFPFNFPPAKIDKSFCRRKWTFKKHWQQIDTDVCLFKVSPSMRSDELAVCTLEMKGVEVKAQDLWTTFEVIENGEMGRVMLLLNLKNTLKTIKIKTCRKFNLWMNSFFSKLLEHLTIFLLKLTDTLKRECAWLVLLLFHGGYYEKLLTDCDGIGGRGRQVVQEWFLPIASIVFSFLQITTW